MSIYIKDQPMVKNDPYTNVGEFSYGDIISVERKYDPAISRLTIGNFCSFGAGIRFIYFGSHQLYDCSTFPFFAFGMHGWPPVATTPVDGQDIIVGNDVYIANFAIIMQGAVIPDGCVIGAFSVVKSKKLKPYHIYAGNPARSVGQRFSDEKIEMFLQMKWWDWPLEMIKKHLQLISSPDIEGLYNIWKEEIK